MVYHRRQTDLLLCTILLLPPLKSPSKHGRWRSSLLLYSISMVQQRIIFKTLLLTFKCLHNMVPAYLKLIPRYKPRRTLRSSTLTLLEVPPLPRTVSYGARTFAAQAPSLWNELPESIRSINSINRFKKSVKTYLFNQYYQYCNWSVIFLVFLILFWLP